MHNNLSSLQVSKDLTRIALPILYAHPHLGYAAIPKFVRCLQLPSPFVSQPKTSLVRHLTVRASPVSPSTELSKAGAVDGSTLFTIHQSFGALLESVPGIQSFTLKDTLIFHEKDERRLYDALKHIKPIKARLEFRLWDLPDPPNPRALTSTLGPSASVERNRYRSPSGHNPGSQWPTHDREVHMQQAWREAVFKGEDLFLPPTWLDPSRLNDNHPNHNPANAAQIQQAMQLMQQQNMAAAAAILQANQAQNAFNVNVPHFPPQQAQLLQAGPAGNLPPALHLGHGASQLTFGQYAQALGSNAPAVAASTTGQSDDEDEDEDDDVEIVVDDTELSSNSFTYSTVVAPTAEPSIPVTGASAQAGPSGATTDTGGSSGVEDAGEDSTNGPAPEAESLTASDSPTAAVEPSSTPGWWRTRLGPPAGGTSNDDAPTTTSSIDASNEQPDSNGPATATSSASSNALASSSQQSDWRSLIQPLFPHRTWQNAQDWDQLPPPTQTAMFIQPNPRLGPRVSPFRNEGLSESSNVNSMASGSGTSAAQDEPTSDSAAVGPSQGFNFRLVHRPSRSAISSGGRSRISSLDDSLETSLNQAREDLTDHLLPEHPSSTSSVAVAMPSQVNSNQTSAVSTDAVPPSIGDADVAFMPNESKTTGHSLAHSMRLRLAQLLTHQWASELQAFSFVAFDPAASIIVRAPRLDFWTAIAVPHIRVHLPPGCNSLVGFKGVNEIERDRRRRERLRATAAAQAIPDSQPLLDHIINATMAGQNIQLGQLPAIPPPPVNPANAAATHTDASSELDDGRVVGGDGEGGDLVHPSNRLFEIEVNSLAEMEDPVWINCGDELPPQVCRILADQHDWRELRMGPPGSPCNEATPVVYIPSPSTSQFNSPTFSFVSLDDDDVHGGVALPLERETSAGATYDAEAAREQLRKIELRRASHENLDRA